MDAQYNIGRFAKSIAGHDAEKLYVIIGEKDGQMLVSNGILKPVQSPKKKKAKHLKIYSASVSEETLGLIKHTAGGVNEAIKREILLNRKELI